MFLQLSSCLLPLDFTGGINDIVGQIVAECAEQAVPVVFAMNRRKLAVLLKKSHRIGCVGIFYYDGADVSYCVATMELT